MRRQNRVNNGKLLGLSTVADVQQNPPSLGKGAKTKPLERDKGARFVPPVSIWTPRTPSWNRTVRFRRKDLLEVCADSDSLLIQAVENAGGECLRTSFWNGHHLSTRRGRERLHFFCSANRPGHFWFSPPCGSHSSTQRVVSQTGS